MPVLPADLSASSRCVLSKAITSPCNYCLQADQQCGCNRPQQRPQHKIMPMLPAGWPLEWLRETSAVTQAARQSGPCPMSWSADCRQLPRWPHQQTSSSSRCVKGRGTLWLTTEMVSRQAGYWQTLCPVGSSVASGLSLPTLHIEASALSSWAPFVQ